MALTKTQKHLIVSLRILGIDSDTTLGIVSALPYPKQQDAIMNWLCEHKGITTSKILKQVALLADNP